MPKEQYLLELNNKMIEDVSVVLGINDDCIDEKDVESCTFKGSGYVMNTSPKSLEIIYINSPVKITDAILASIVNKIAKNENIVVIFKINKLRLDISMIDVSKYYETEPMDVKIGCYASACNKYL